MNAKALAPHPASLGARDADSLGDCTRRAGVALAALPPLVADLDKPWQARLDANGRHDNLYLVWTPA